MRKERFPMQKKSKLQPQGHSLFLVIGWINDKAYKIDFLDKYNVGVIFNVFYLSSFDIGKDLITNLFEEIRTNENQGSNHGGWHYSSTDPLCINSYEG